MVLPAHVADAAARVLAAASGTLRAEPVHGGCISPAARVMCSGTRRSVFAKWATAETPAGLFEQEAISLAALAATGAVRVPAVLHANARLLILEWLEPGKATTSGWRNFGRALAALHRASADAFGWSQDNFIGPLPQRNTWHGSWTEFYQQRRIGPQLERAFALGAFDNGQRKLLERFHESLARILAHDPAPSLLHGDLWSGNAHALENGEVALIDPASCYGDREMDLAMAALFGGIPASFFDSYDAEWPRNPALRDERRAAYQVYYLLVHVNLFGAAYVAQTISSAQRALG